MLAKLKISSRDLGLMLIYAFIDALAMQVYIDLFTSGFKITMSVVTLPVFLYFYRQINPIYQSIFITTIGLFIRTLFYVPTHGTYLHVLLQEYPTMAFDLTYGILMYMLFFRQKDKSDSRWFAVILLCDFVANSTELIVRSGRFDERMAQDMIILLTVAGIRSVMSLLIVSISKYYRLLLMKEEHSERYKNLLLLTSELKGETYFMKKNMDYIEEVMNSAYQLYEQLGTLNLPKDIKSLPLNIAKDVHEIKKDYIRVIRGLENIMGMRADDSDMQLSELFEILVSTARKSLPDDLNGVMITSVNDRDFRIREHYLLMSVLRNLVVNAQEAMVPNGSGNIGIWQFSEGDNCIFRVQDDGCGIKLQHVEHIFNPGFSTKFNIATGDISRGLGLTLVRDIIHEKFNGTIRVESEPGKGTAFILKIPYANLEVGI